MRGTVGTTGVKVNVAPTLVLLFTVTLHEVVPEQAPVHPPNEEPATGAAVKDNVVPAFTVSEQSDPQLIPVAVTLPDPVPDFETDTAYVTGATTCGTIVKLSSCKFASLPRTMSVCSPADRVKVLAGLLFSVSPPQEAVRSSVPDVTSMCQILLVVGSESILMKSELLAPLGALSLALTVYVPA